METLAATPTKNNNNRRTNKHLSRNSRVRERQCWHTVSLSSDRHTGTDCSHNNR